MNTGKLRFKLLLQTPDGEERRGVPTTYTDVGYVWASIKPLKVAEANSNGQLKIMGSFEITCWANEAIDETCRFKHGEIIYNITEVLKLDFLRHEMKITAVRQK